MVVFVVDVDGLCCSFGVVIIVVVKVFVVVVFGVLVGVKW